MLTPLPFAIDSAKHMTLPTSNLRGRGLKFGYDLANTGLKRNQITLFFPVRFTRAFRISRQLCILSKRIGEMNSGTEFCTMFLFTTIFFNKAWSITFLFTGIITLVSVEDFQSEHFCFL